MLLETASPPPSEEPFYGANKAVIHTVDNPENARETMAQLFEERGFTFRNNESSPTIVTEWAVLPNLGSDRAIKVSAFVENMPTETLVTLRGWLRQEDAAGDASTPVVYVGGPDSTGHAAFAELEALARAYPGATVTFEQD